MRAAFVLVLAFSFICIMLIAANKMENVVTAPALITKALVHGER